MNIYEALASRYDEFTLDVDYPRRARYVADLLERAKIPVKVVADLACGTGSVSVELAKLGYELLCVDKSSEMLSVAVEKFTDTNGVRPVFIHQDITSLDMYGTYDAAVCLLDSINYISPENLKKAFERIHLFLSPGGVFVFDINTPAKFKAVDGRTYSDESDDAFYVMRCSYREKERDCSFLVDIFSKKKEDLWIRAFEDHREYAYDPEEIKNMLCAAGFQEISVFGEMSRLPPRKDEQRIYFLCFSGKAQETIADGMRAD